MFEWGRLQSFRSRHSIDCSLLLWSLDCGVALASTRRQIAWKFINSRVKAFDVIIWDEASMSSRRMFELMNFLHHELATDELSKSLPFAGKQIILVGEFLQLQPVPSLFDEGDFMFYSPLLDFGTPHRLALTRLMRQLEDDKLFLSTIADIRKGQCSISS